jgi:hypothetical protein
VHNLLPSTIAAKAKVLPHLAPPMPRSPKDAQKPSGGAMHTSSHSMQLSDNASNGNLSGFIFFVIV